MSFFTSCSLNREEEKTGRMLNRDNYKNDVIANNSHSSALKMGFQPDEFYDIYTLEGFGAFYFNVSSKIKRVEELKDVYDAELKYYPYIEIAKLMSKGYNFVLGPAFPMTNGQVSNYCVGLYCTNHTEMVEKENQESLTV